MAAKKKDTKTQAGVEPPVHPIPSAAPVGIENEGGGHDGTEGLLGQHDGVSVRKTESGELAVAFAFERQLVAMMSNVPGATFDKGASAYLVPAASIGALEKVVPKMRKEARETSNDLEAITALAAASGHKAQEENGVAAGVEPKVSTFRGAGKFYAGEIVNANARFAAQMTGFGKNDGAAFVTVHRLSDLDRPLLKGDSVKIQYDDRLAGRVSVLSKDKSVAELETDFKNNLGQKVDGVTVTDRGDKVGIAFDIHPALLARIRRVEGAAFNTEDKVWEVPKEKQEFALRAAQDMRDEFVLDSKEAGDLVEFAKSKMDNAKVYPAFTKDGQGCFGVVVEVGSRYALQKGGRESFTLHHLSQLDQVPVKGHDCAIHYRKGVGQVVDHDLRREQDHARGMGR